MISLRRPIQHLIPLEIQLDPDEPVKEQTQLEQTQLDQDETRSGCNAPIGAVQLFSEN